MSVASASAGWQGEHLKQETCTCGHGSTILSINKRAGSDVVNDIPLMAADISIALTVQA